MTRTKKEVFWITIVIGISVIVFGFIAIKIIHNYRISTALPKTITTTPPVVIPSTTSTERESTEWVTYSDPRLGFSFLYPKDWQVQSYATATIPGLTLRSPETKRKLQNGELLGYDFDFTVDVWPDINVAEKNGDQWIGKRIYKNLDDFMTDKKSLEQSTGTTTVDGLPAYEVIIGGDGQFYAVLVEREKLYEFGFQTAWDKTYLTPDQKKILSSIRFLK